MDYPYITPNAYFDADVAGVGDAFAAAGVHVSMSPGDSVTPSNLSYVRANDYAVAMRVTEDLWDTWTSNTSPSGGTGYPTGVAQKLDKAIEFAAFAGAGANTLSDLDMLPLGFMMHGDPAHGAPYGPPGPSHLTNDEQLTVMTLWCVTGSQLIMGGRLPLQPGDMWTLSLLTNTALLSVHNNSIGRRPVPPMGQGNLVGGPLYAWTALPADGCPGGASSCAYVALFNANNATAPVGVGLADVGLPVGTPACATDLWAGAAVPGVWTQNFTQSIATHGAGMYLLVACDVN
jgi:hypothetical protein